MGKYMRKSKTKGEVALMDVSSQQSSLGVRTRAKTLALQRLQKSSSSAAAAAAAVSSGGSGSGSGSGSYIQLRSRRLEKPPVLVTNSESKRQRCVTNPNSSSRALAAVNSNSDGPSESKLVENTAEVEEIKKNEESVDLGIEASFGENVLEFDGRERSTRESTPCSLIRDPDTIRTPGSSTRPTTSADDANRIVRNSMQRHIPTANEMDEFFAVTEGKQQKQFMDKYNFDPVNDKPLPGRFEWIKVDTKKC